MLPVSVPAGGQTDNEGSITRTEYTGGDLFRHKAAIRYAGGFEVEYHENYKVVTVSTPWPNAAMSFEYVLVQRGTPPPSGTGDALIIEIPSERVITLSTTYLAFFDMLGLTDKLIGHDDFKYVYSPRVRELIEEGRIGEVGEGSKINVELVLDMDPDLIMTFHAGSDQDAYPKLLEAGLPVVLNAEYVEKEPLAMAEWIKFIALFFNEEEEAERIFQDIAFRYNDLKDRVSHVQYRPTVLLGAPFQGIWWMAGGSSFFATILDDAGGDFLWKDNDSTGAIPLDFEAVYARAAAADFWLNTGTWERCDDALDHDQRFAEFKAYRTRAMFNNDRRKNRYGGNDFWESGRANPDTVLADLISILHPELLQDHSLVYYRKLD
jgi:iron complex transport system substrate-binding protein